MKKLTTALTLAGLCTLPLMSQAAAYKEVAVSNGGAISGKVTFSGTDEPPKAYTISKDNNVCGEGNREIDFVNVKNGVLQDMVVYLDKVNEGKAFPAEVGDGEALQQGCQFKPFLGVMRNGQKLAAINKDPVLHNIHTYELIGQVKKTVFNVSQPDQNTVTKEVSLKKGVAMKIECDAHDFMHAFAFVANNPYFAVVKEDGSFSIDNVPPGKYTLKTWHGSVKEQKSKVEVAAGGSVTVDFDLK